MKGFHLLAKSILSALFISLITFPAHAAAIIYLTDNRSSDVGIITTPSTPFEDWASVPSSFGPNGFSATGVGANTFSFYEKDIFDITFQLDTSTDFSLTGALSSSVIDGTGPFSNATIALYDGTGLIYSAGAYSGYTDDPFTNQVSYYGANVDILFQQLLAAGEYRIVAIADPAGISGTSQFNLIADATVVSSVPIPAAIWLFGSGLIGLVGLAKRKKA